MKLRKNKKGVELSLQTIALLVLVLVALLVMIIFFSKNYSSGSDVLLGAGKDAIEGAKNFS